MGKKGTPHRKYSKEEKMRYVRLHLEDHISVRQIERDYGIGNALVSSWVKRYLQDGEDALEPHNGNPYAALHRSKSLSEVERLRLLVAKQEVEIARLKKGYWVEGAGANREYVTGSGKTTKFSKDSSICSFFNKLYYCRFGELVVDFSLYSCTRFGISKSVF